QCLLTAAQDWRTAIERAKRDRGPFDVCIVILSRLHPWVFPSLEGSTVLDAIDSLYRSAQERARATRGVKRWFWRWEEKRMARLEAEATRVYDRIVVVSDHESADFGNAESVTIGVEVRPLHDSLRAFDFGFWGRLPYFANADAVNWLLEEIWPAIRALNPSAT